MTDTPLLACSGLTVRFGGLTALDGLDLTVARGEIIGPIGPNGWGKITFFNAITGLYRVAHGNVIFVSGSAGWCSGSDRPPPLGGLPSVDQRAEAIVTG